MSEWAAAFIVASSPPDICMMPFFKTDIITFPVILLKFKTKIFT